jgi:plasmid stabilization system protein ParE
VKLVYSAEAVQDLVRLREFIAEKDPMAAARVAAELVARIENLCLFPEIGRNVELAPPNKSLKWTAQTGAASQYCAGSVRCALRAPLCPLALR